MWQAGLIGFEANLNMGADALARPDQSAEECMPCTWTDFCIPQPTSGRCTEGPEWITCFETVNLILTSTVGNSRNNGTRSCPESRLAEALVTYGNLTTHFKNKVMNLDWRENHKIPRVGTPFSVLRDLDLGHAPKLSEIYSKF